MDSDGHQPSLLAEADAGHGFAPAWSPDSSQIAFVERANPDDPQVELSASVLRSNLYRIAAAGGTPVAVTDWTDAIVGSPLWSPDGTALLFNVARNDTIQVWDEHTGALQPLADEASCCAVWVPGR